MILHIPLQTAWRRTGRYELLHVFIKAFKVELFFILFFSSFQKKFSQTEHEIFLI